MLSATRPKATVAAFGPGSPLHGFGLPVLGECKVSSRSIIRSFDRPVVPALISALFFRCHGLRSSGRAAHISHGFAFCVSASFCLFVLCRLLCRSQTVESRHNFAN